MSAQVELSARGYGSAVAAQCQSILRDQINEVVGFDYQALAAGTSGKYGLTGRGADRGKSRPSQQEIREWKTRGIYCYKSTNFFAARRTAESMARQHGYSVLSRSPKQTGWFVLRRLPKDTSELWGECELDGAGQPYWVRAPKPVTDEPLPLWEVTYRDPLTDEDTAVLKRGEGWQVEEWIRSTLPNVRLVDLCALDRDLPMDDEFNTDNLLYAGCSEAEEE